MAEPRLTRPSTADPSATSPIARSRVKASSLTMSRQNVSTKIAAGVPRIADLMMFAGTRWNGWMNLKIGPTTLAWDSADIASPGSDPSRPNGTRPFKAKLASRCWAWPSSTYFWAKSVSSWPLSPCDSPMRIPSDRLRVCSSAHTSSVKFTAFMKSLACGLSMATSARFLPLMTASRMVAWVLALA